MRDNQISKAIADKLRSMVESSEFDVRLTIENEEHGGFYWVPIGVIADSFEAFLKTGESDLDRRFKKKIGVM